MSTRREFLKSVIAGAGAVGVGMLPKDGRSRTYDSGIEVFESYHQPKKDYPDEYDFDTVSRAVKLNYHTQSGVPKIDIHKPTQVLHLYRYIKEMRRAAAGEEMRKYDTPIMMITPHAAEFNIGTNFSDRTFKNLRNCGVTWGDRSFCILKVLGRQGWYFINGKEMVRDQLVPITKKLKIDYVKDIRGKREPFDFSVIGVSYETLKGQNYSVPS